MLVLKYEYENDWGNKLYKDSEGTYFIKRYYNDEILYLGGNPENDPVTNIRNIEKYKDLKVVLKGGEDPTEQEKKRYNLLSKLDSNLDKYIRGGCKNKEYLLNNDEAKHIEKMKNLHNSFSKYKKPNWLEYEDILYYENILHYESELN